MDDLSVSIMISRRKHERDVPQKLEGVSHPPEITLDPGEHTREHWWVSHHIAHQRYITMTKQRMHLARTSGSAPRYFRVETALRNLYYSSVAIAASINRSQLYWIDAERSRVMANSIEKETSDDSDSVRDLEERCRCALSDVPTHILE